MSLARHHRVTHSNKTAPDKVPKRSFIPSERVFDNVWEHQVTVITLEGYARDCSFSLNTFTTFCVESFGDMVDYTMDRVADILVSTDDRALHEDILMYADSLVSETTVAEWKPEWKQGSRVTIAPYPYAIRGWYIKYLLPTWNVAAAANVNSPVSAAQKLLDDLDDLPETSHMETLAERFDDQMWQQAMFKNGWYELASLPSCPPQYRSIIDVVS